MMRPCKLLIIIFIFLFMCIYRRQQEVCFYAPIEDNNEPTLVFFMASIDKRQWWTHANYSSSSFVVLFMFCKWQWAHASYSSCSFVVLFMSHRWWQAHANYSLFFFVVLFMSCRWQRVNLIHRHFPFFVHALRRWWWATKNDNEPTKLVVIFCVLLMGYKQRQAN